MSIPIRHILAPSIAEAVMDDCLKVPRADVRHCVYDSLGIDEVRELKEMSTHTALSNTGQTFVVWFRAVTIEAQHALLKLTEEPPPETEIVFITPDTVTFLPTLSSRFVLGLGIRGIANTVLAESFIALSFKERLKHVADHIDKKDEQWTTALISSLDAILRTHHDARWYQEAHKALSTAEQFMSIRGASKKQLLEHVALAFPLKLQ